MKYFELGPFTVFDVETTGMSPERDRIIQIGAVRIDRDGYMSRFNSFVNPGRAIPPALISVHHITDEMVSAAPNFSRVGREFLEFADGSTLVAHNARFDLGFLQESLARTGRRCGKAGHWIHCDCSKRPIRGCLLINCRVCGRYFSLIRMRVCRLTGRMPTWNGRCKFWKSL